MSRHASTASPSVRQPVFHFYPRRIPRSIESFVHTSSQRATGYFLIPFFFTPQPLSTGLQTTFMTYTFLGMESLESGWVGDCTFFLSERMEIDGQKHARVQGRGKAEPWDLDWIGWEGKWGNLYIVTGDCLTAKKTSSEGCLQLGLFFAGG